MQLQTPASLTSNRGNIRQKPIALAQADLIAFAKERGLMYLGPILQRKKEPLSKAKHKWQCATCTDSWVFRYDNLQRDSGTQKMSEHVRVCSGIIDNDPLSQSEREMHDPELMTAHQRGCFYNKLKHSRDKKGYKKREAERLKRKRKCVQFRREEQLDDTPKRKKAREDEVYRQQEQEANTARRAQARKDDAHRQAEQEANTFRRTEARKDPHYHHLEQAFLETHRHTQRSFFHVTVKYVYMSNPTDR